MSNSECSLKMIDMRNAKERKSKTLKTVFHGTVNAAVKSIKKDGLFPGSWLTDDLGFAEHYACEKAAQLNLDESDAVVIVLAVEPNRLTDGGMYFEYMLDARKLITIPGFFDDKKRRANPEGGGEKNIDADTVSVKKTQLYI